MGSKAFSEPVGVVGAGQFGTVIANLLAEKVPVWLYTRDPAKAAQLNKSRQHLNYPLHARIRVLSSLKEVTERCNVLFPIVPSAAFSELIAQMSPYLRPSHMLIHGTKGFGLRDETRAATQTTLSKEDTLTISQIIQEKTSVLRIGCISGPNIAQEIAKGLPAATIIASRYDEVIYEGQRLLKNNHFLVYGSRDLIGVELCGVLKNIIAIAAGLLDSLALGNNAKSLLISRGMVDMVQIGRVLGSSAEAFLGLAGVGDVITSCFSPMGRNFRVGRLLAEGKQIDEILHKLKETAEGIRTIHIVIKLAKHYKVRCLVAEILYKIMHQEMSIPAAGQLLMKLPFAYDTYHFFSE